MYSMKSTDHARLLSKGKSFEYSTWQEFVKYSNDCFKQDFISFNGALLACKVSHISTSENKPILLYEHKLNKNQVTGVISEYWEFVLTGTPGLTYTPIIDENGNLSWELKDGTPSSINIKGPKGDKGEQGIQGKPGEKGDRGEKGEKGDSGNGNLEIGSGDPTQPGYEGDVYLDIDSGNFYKTSSNNWIPVGKISVEDSSLNIEWQDD